jgi:hypothetical protein
MNYVEIEQTNLVGITLDCNLSWSKHDTAVAKTILTTLSTITINKAGPTGPSFVAPRLYFSSVVSCHKEGLAIGSEQGSTSGP